MRDDECGALALASTLHPHGAAVQAPTRCFTIERPRPSPPCRRVVEASACRNRSNTNARNSGLMPMPVSSTVTSTWEFTRSSTTSMRPPAGGEFHRVGQQVPEHLLQAVRVAARAADLRVEHHTAGEVSSHRSDGRTASTAPRDDFPQIDRLDVELHLAGNDAAHVQQVADDLRSARAHCARWCRGRAHDLRCLPARRLSSVDQPRMAFSGVRSSWRRSRGTHP